MLSHGEEPAFPDSFPPLSFRTAVSFHAECSVLRLPQWTGAGIGRTCPPGQRVLPGSLSPGSSSLVRSVLTRGGDTHSRPSARVCFSPSWGQPPVLSGCQPSRPPLSKLFAGDEKVRRGAWAWFLSECGLPSFSSANSLRWSWVVGRTPTLVPYGAYGTQPILAIAEQAIAPPRTLHRPGQRSVTLVGISLRSGACAVRKPLYPRGRGTASVGPPREGPVP